MTDTLRVADWATEHTMAAGSLDPRAPLDDLEPLREVIGSARVVAIGESAHYVREFYLLRHRLLRFLAERCGFTIYALEAPFTEAHAIDAWGQGGPGTVAEVAAYGIAIDIGRCREMHELLAWMRGRNRATEPPLRFAGTDVPASGGSPLPALEEVAAYLRWADPDALPLLERAIDLAHNYHDPAAQDALTASLSRLLSRMETMGAYQRKQHRVREHATALQHLRGAWYLDHLHRDIAGRGLALGSASRDAFMAESVLRLLEDGAPDTRIVVASHNVHIQKTPEAHDGPFGLFPQGYHLAQALGDDYVAIAATSGAGRAARILPDPEHPMGFEICDRPLPSLADGSIETAFATQAPLAVVDLRAARPAVHDAGSFQRMRMEDYFMDVPVFDAFDAVAYIPETRVSPREP